jgi:hypothetical protein
MKNSVFESNSAFSRLNSKKCGSQEKALTELKKLKAGTQLKLDLA